MSLALILTVLSFALSLTFHMIKKMIDLTAFKIFNGCGSIVLAFRLVYLNHIPAAKKLAVVKVVDETIMDVSCMVCSYEL